MPCQAIYTAAAITMLLLTCPLAGNGIPSSSTSFSPIDFTDIGLTMNTHTLKSVPGTFSADQINLVEQNTPLGFPEHSELVNRLSRHAVRAVRNCWREQDGYGWFVAGKHFPEGVFSRDVCYAGLLGLNGW